MSCWGSRRRVGAKPERLIEQYWLSFLRPYGRFYPFDKILATQLGRLQLITNICRAD